MESPYQTIILIGPPASGKTAAGQELACLLAWHFYDTDKIIEEREGLTISEIIENLGESYFRKLETFVLDGLARLVAGNRGRIIATGGGLPATAGNIQRLASLGEMISLTAQPYTLVKRIKKNQDTRPLLMGIGGTDEELVLYLAKLIKQRETVYDQAQYKIDTTFLTPVEVACEILKLLRLKSFPS